MLLNLKTIHQPATLSEALTLLRQAGTFPLYGGAALQRNPRPDVEAVVDLSQIGLERVWEEGDSLHLGSMLTLERVRLICQERGQTYPLLGGVAEALRADLPETLRNTFTLGDLLVERDAQSVTLTLLLALDAAIVTADESAWPLADWLASGDDAWRVLVTHVSVPRGATRAAVAFEKVSRTPADAPIVGAVAAVQITAEGRRTALALCGVAPWPQAQPEAARAFDQSGEVNAALEHLVLDPPGDHWGSREYRLEMARVLTRRALLAAVEKVK
jgi:CO/xanthine dehydrogenase FAD-binding subunit